MNRITNDAILLPFVAYPVHEFLDSNTDLKLVFPPQTVEEMQQRIHEAEIIKTAQT